MAAFEWSEKATRAALALAEGATREEAAKQADISERTVYRWIADPEFSAEVDRLSLMIGIASRAHRLRIAQRLARQRIDESGFVLSKADLLDWLKFAQSETDGVKLDLAKLATALGADAPPVAD